MLYESVTAMLCCVSWSPAGEQYPGVRHLEGEREGLGTTLAKISWAPSHIFLPPTAARTLHPALYQLQILSGTLRGVSPGRGRKVTPSPLCLGELLLSTPAPGGAAGP